MISAWWLIVAFWLGACCGVLLTALLIMSRRAEEAREQAEHDALGQEPDGKLSH
jgi:ABC-type nitrate/sulfonate/bicarbonate transport system permease component